VGLREEAYKSETEQLGRLIRLGFKSLAECLLSVPKEYLDFTKPVKRLGNDLVGTKNYFILRVINRAVFGENGQPCPMGKGAMRMELHSLDDAGVPVVIVVFGSLWPWKNVQLGQLVHVYGMLETFRGMLRVKSPQLVAAASRGTIAAIYPGKPSQVKGESLAAAVCMAMHRIEDAECALLAQAGLRESEFPRDSGFKNASELLQALHRPKRIEEALAATQVARLLSADAVVRKAMVARMRPPSAESSVSIKRDDIAKLLGALPFALTKDQRQAIDDIAADLRSPYPMRRLLSGDVGTGKSVVFMVPAVAAYMAGASVAILAPSVLVVEQIARELRAYFPDTPVTELKAGGQLGEGIHVGTTALLNAAVKAGKVFELVITDEQQKFSVDQKSGMTAGHTNVLEATATAIPRTLALVQFGGMEVSVLRECPVKKSITTHITMPADKGRLTAYFKAALERGHQAAVIYPLVENGRTKPHPGGDAGGVRGEVREARDEQTVEKVPGDPAPGGEYYAVQVAAVRWAEHFPGRVGMLHGKMSSDEKTEVIRRMREKEFDILVSSVVIEIGVTLPSLKAMLIVHPERYGVSQIHQLRGRLARKGGAGKLFLHVEGELDDEAWSRLRLLEECNDGFTLAERDMDLRGFGDVHETSTSQTGTVRNLFWGVSPTAAELDASSKRLGLKGNISKAAAKG
jgi:ATP-dependent DNA helicase RecG